MFVLSQERPHIRITGLAHKARFTHLMKYTVQFFSIQVIINIDIFHAMSSETDIPFYLILVYVAILALPVDLAFLTQ